MDTSVTAAARADNQITKGEPEPEATQAKAEMLILITAIAALVVPTAEGTTLLRTALGPEAALA